MAEREKKKTLAEEAYEKLCSKICDFELYPGQEISDFTLCKQLGMSRTPVRQALVQLEQDGLVCDAGVGKSYKVSEITKEEIEDIFDVREAIEANALRLSMERGIRPEELKELEQINSRMEKQNEEGNKKLQFYYDQMFHNTLVVMCGNRRMKRFYESLCIQLKRMRVLSYLESSYQRKAYDDHSEVLRQMEAGNMEQSIEALVHHIRTSKRDYCDLIQNKVSLDSYGMLRFLMKNAE